MTNTQKLLRTLSVLIPLIMLILWLAFPQSQAELHFDKLHQSYLKQEQKKQPLAISPNGAGEYFNQKRAPRNGVQISSENYVNAVHSKREFLNSQRVFNAEPWQNLGPDFVGGRTRSLVFHPDNPDIMFAGGVSGGVWKSLNAGQSWEPIADDLENIAVVTLAISPQATNTIFAGTGEGVYVGRPVVRSRGVEGNGIYRSINGGESWQAIPFTLNNPDFKFVNKIRIAQDGTLFAATVRGLWRSLDNGNSWQLTLDQAERVGGCTEVEIQPGSNPAQLLASCGSFESAAVYKSSDNGVSWQSVIEEQYQGRTTIAYAPSNPNRVYALSAQNQLGPFPYGLNGLYRSDDGGDNWQQVANSNSANLNSRSLLSTTNYVFDCSATGQYQDGRLAGGGWYYNLITVDPVDENRVWAGGLDLWRSDDGGENFGLGSFWWASTDQPSYIHADHHLLIYHPNYDGLNERRLFATNDGGIWQTTNSTSSVASDNCSPSSTNLNWQALNNQYAVTQFYHGSVSQDGQRVIAGSQDNGSLLRQADGQWQQILGGDGAYSAFDPEDDSTVYVSSQYANLVKLKLNSTANQEQNISRNFDGLGLFITPFILDQNNSSQLWLAGLGLWRGDNNGNWVKSSRNEYPQNFIDGLSAIAVQPGNSNLVLLGGSDGHIFRHTNALSGTGDSIMQKIKITDGFISSINFDRNNPDKVVASVSTFGELHGWLSNDAGISWQAIDSAGAAGLPDLPVHDIIIAPHDTNTFYAATDIGVYISQNNGNTWQPLTTGLPNVVVEKLVYNRADLQSHLFAFTYGRGVFKSKLSNVQNFAPVALTASIRLSGLQNNALTLDLREHFDDQNGDKLNYTATGLPEGLNLSSAGLLSGSTAVATGEYKVNVVASDGELEANAELLISLSQTVSPPTPTPNSSSGGGSLFYLLVGLFGVVNLRKRLK